MCMIIGYPQESMVPDRKNSENILGKGTGLLMSCTLEGISSHLQMVSHCHLAVVFGFKIEQASGDHLEFIMTYSLFIEVVSRITSKGSAEVME